MQSLSTVEPRIRQPRFRQEGRLGDLFMLHIVNLLLRWVTLNIYHFWGKTRIREYLWSHLNFEGGRFEYTGRGGELFAGFLKAMGAVILLIALAGFVFTIFRPTVGPLIAAASSIVTIVSHFITALAAYSTRGYILSRTRWRSIRFSQTGAAPRFALQSTGHGLLLIATLGLYWPIRRHILLRTKINNTRFGNASFSYDGSGKDLYHRFLMSVLLTVPTLGFVWFWYMARDAAYVAAHTRFEGLRFEITYTGGQLLQLRLGNLAIAILTFGFGYPWVLLRNVNFLFAHLLAEGELGYEQILQSEGAAPRSGEGLAEIFGMTGSFLGLGRI